MGRMSEKHASQAITEPQENSPEAYPLWVHELAESDANVGRLLHAAKFVLEGMQLCPEIETDDWQAILSEAIAKAEKRP